MSAGPSKHQPSYLLLDSLDATRAQLSKNRYTIFHTPIHLAHQLADEVKTLIPNACVGESPDKTCIRSYARIIIPDLQSQKSLTSAVSLGTCREHVRRVMLDIKDMAAMYGLDSSGRAINHYECAPFGEISTKLSPREALFSNKRNNVEESLGEICGELICTFPPGMPGAVITQSALSCHLNARDGGAMISGAADSHLHSIVEDKSTPPFVPILEAQKKVAELLEQQRHGFLLEEHVEWKCRSCQHVHWGDMLILPRNSHVSAISGMGFRSQRRLMK
ncbi:hypothetical protein EJ110_NYTH24898 [Nymphaea thermarum]|nr:hypothetical protein EJ110_NYTH24898 [Nymphaea thermarum]